MQGGSNLFDEDDDFRWVVTAAHCVHGNSDKDNKDVWVSIERAETPELIMIVFAGQGGRS